MWEIPYHAGLRFAQFENIIESVQNASLALR